MLHGLPPRLLHGSPTWTASFVDDSVRRRGWSCINESNVRELSRVKTVLRRTPASGRNVSRGSYSTSGEDPGGCRETPYTAVLGPRASQGIRHGHISAVAMCSLRLVCAVCCVGLQVVLLCCWDPAPWGTACLLVAGGGLVLVLLIFVHTSPDHSHPSVLRPTSCNVTGSLHESSGHSRYKKLKSNRGLRASRSRRCPIMAPATMAGPTMGKEACLGTVGEAWTRRLDGCVVGRRPPHRRR